MTNCTALTIDALSPCTLKRPLRTLASGVLAISGCMGSMAAWAQDDHLQQQRRLELRSMVRQQLPMGVGSGTNLAQASTSDNAALTATQRHLSFEERTELRRQLARDLPAQRGTGNTLQQ